MRLDNCFPAALTFLSQATIFMCALFACSVYWLRRKEYELFLVLHIGLSILILATMLG